LTKAIDISSKRLISLSATAWVQWLTGDLMDVVIDAPALHVVVAQVDAQLA
jgi:hypothetical protein